MTGTKLLCSNNNNRENGRRDSQRGLSWWSNCCVMRIVGVIALRWRLSENGRDCRRIKYEFVIAFSLSSGKRDNMKKKDRKRSQRKKIGRAPRQNLVGHMDKSWTEYVADEQRKEKKETRIEKTDLEQDSDLDRAGLERRSERRRRQQTSRGSNM